MTTSPALIRYRARVAERRLLIDELRKRAGQIRELVGEFNHASTRDTYWRLRHFENEAWRCIGLLERLPEPKRPAKRKAKRAALRLVRGAS